MPGRSDLDRRYAMARASTKAAEAARDAAIARASALLLAKLKARPVEQRFAALADPKLRLTAADRRILVRSIRGAAVARPVIAAGTATSWEVWRSRMRHRPFATGLAAAAVLATAALASIGWHHTPVQWVVVTATEPFTVPWSYSNGVTAPSRVSPGARYAALRVMADQVQLRYWQPGAGYATFWVPRDLVAAAPNGTVPP